ncbi:MAG: hypothetical protein ABI234_03310 [Ktedonobacteraceae bacterium]
MTIVDVLKTATIALVSVVPFLRWNINSLFLIARAALLGLLHLFHPCF